MGINWRFRWHGWRSAAGTMAGYMIACEVEESPIDFRAPLKGTAAVEQAKTI